MKKQTDDLRAGVAFEPRCVYDVLPVMKTTLSEKVSGFVRLAEKPGFAARHV